MDFVYDFLGKLPFDFLSSGFMKSALLAVLFSSILFGMIGTLAVDNKMAFFSDALGHSAMTGIALGVVLGVRNELVCLIAFGILMALLINKVRSGGTASTDTVISVFSSTALALGLLLLSKYQGVSKYSSYLVGDILSVSRQEVLLLFIALLVVGAVWCFVYNKLLLISVNRSLAASRGVRVVLYENIFSVMVAVVVMLSIKWVGVLLINSLLILPAAAARNISRSVRQYHLFSVLFAVASGLGGLIASWYLAASSGATIVMIAAGIFFLTYCARKLFGR